MTFDSQVTEYDIDMCVQIKCVYNIKRRERKKN